MGDCTNNNLRLIGPDILYGCYFSIIIIIILIYNNICFTSMKMLLFPFSDLLLLLYRKSNHKYIYLLFPIVANIGTVIVTVINTAIILFVLPAREGLPESEGVSMFSFVRASHIMAVSFDSLSLNAHRGKVSLTLPRWKCRKKNCSTEYFQICEIT